jgi:hypothetical protein
MEDNFQFKPIQQNILPQKEKNPFFNKRNIPKISAIVIVVGLLMVVGAILWGRSLFNVKKVELSIVAPDEISSGEETILIVKYKNNNRVALTDARLTLNYPQGIFSADGEQIFQDIKDIGTINSRQGGQAEFVIRLVGDRGEAKNVTARLDYKPQNINAHFENNNALKIEINKILISLNILGSEKVVAGQETSYLIECENKLDEDINNLEIQMEYPEQFQFKSADPVPKSEKENNFWQIDSLKANEKRSITLIGVLNGQEMENKVLRGTIGKEENGKFLQYSASEFITQISAAPILLDVSVNDISNDCKTETGKYMNYKINFRNNTDVALEELILKAYLQDSVFNLRKIELNNKGFFDSRNNVITWSGADVRELKLLEPNQSGAVSFSVLIKDALSIINFNDKNFSARVIAEIQTLTVPAKFANTELKFEKELSCKINSYLGLITKVYYYEPSLGISNSGPIPPRVNNTTTYTVHWLITNTSNDLDNVEVRTTLPQGISWADKQINKSNKGEVSYNDRTKEVVWRLGRIAAGIGKTMPAYELIFQIGLTPSINQIGTAPTLIDNSMISGKDLFTENTLSNSAAAVNADLPDDNRVDFDSGRVRE